jgi:hypothetical protein
MRDDDADDDGLDREGPARAPAPEAEVRLRFFWKNASGMVGGESANAR